MADLTTTPSYDPVYQLETTDLVLGGAGAISNDQAQALGNRDDYLLSLVENGFYSSVDGATMSYSYPSVVSFTPVSGTLYVPSGNAATYVLPAIATVDDEMTFAVSCPYGLRTYLRAAAGEIIRDYVSQYGALNQHPIWWFETLIVKKPAGATEWVILGRHLDVPAGTIAMRFETPNNSSPWIVCNGSTISASEYPRLFALYGYAFGGSGGSFGVPYIAPIVVSGRTIYYFTHS